MKMVKRRAIVFNANDKFIGMSGAVAERYEIAGIFDYDGTINGKDFNGIPVFGRECFVALVYDCVLVLESRLDFVEIIKSFGVPPEKIHIWSDKSGNEWSESFFTPDGADLMAHFDGISFLMKHTTDYIVANEIFCKSDYNFSIGNDPCAVFDIGMNIGAASLYFANRENVSRVYAFEPFRETFGQAAANFRLNSPAIQSKITAQNFGLSDHDGEETFTYYPEFTIDTVTVHGTTAEDMNREHYDTTVILRDAAKVLSPLFSRHADEKIVMKIDCEGAEYPIFKSMSGAGLIRRVDIFIIETHFGRESEIKELLSGSGFVYFAPYEGGEKKSGKFTP